jgi:multisubunit Na+/H+ antiporter MnhG subunit
MRVNVSIGYVECSVNGLLVYLFILSTILAVLCISATSPVWLHSLFYASEMFSFQDDEDVVEDSWLLQMARDQFAIPYVSQALSCSVVE